MSAASYPVASTKADTKYLRVVDGLEIPISEKSKLIGHMVMKQVEVEVNRFFELYNQFLKNHDIERLINLLGSASRANDRIRKATSNKHSLGLNIDFFVLRALRNQFEHEGELEISLKLFNKELLQKLKPELGFVCLIPRGIFNKALNKTKNLELAREVFSSLQDIKGYIDIYPYIYNFSTVLFEKAFRFQLNISSESYFEVKNSYKKNQVYNVDQFVKYDSLDLSQLPEDFETRLITQDDLTVHHINYVEKKYIGFFYQDKKIPLECFDFDKLFDNFIYNIETLNAVSINLILEKAPHFYDHFNAWSSSKAPIRLRNFLQINSSSLDGIADYTRQIYKAEGEEKYIAVLDIKYPIIEKVFSTLVKKDRAYEFGFVLFCGLFLILYDHKLEFNDSKVIPFFEMIFHEYDDVAFNTIFDKFKRHRKSAELARRVLGSYIILVLLEYPYDDFLSDSIL